MAAPQVAHLPMFMTNVLPVHFGQSPAYAEDEVRTVAKTRNAAATQYEWDLIMSHQLSFSGVASLQNRQLTTIMAGAS